MDPVTVGRELDLRLDTALDGGNQSRVFHGFDAAGERVIVKFAAAEVDPRHRRRRARLVRRLADINPAVVGPIAGRGAGRPPSPMTAPAEAELVVTVDGWDVVCYPFVDGRRPDFADGGDIEAAGSALAELHRSLSEVGSVDLPPVSALRAVDGRGADEPPRPADQLIHGDFGSPNLLMTDDGIRILDFEESGYGSIEFELGNSIYLERFDAWNHGRLGRHRPFPNRFITAYARAAGFDPDRSLIDEAIEQRVAALERWLAHPDEAPIGIRHSSDEWRSHLVDFVKWHRSPGT